MKLKLWRESHKRTQKWLQEKSGVSHVQISRAERGEGGLSVDSAKRIEAATNGEVTAAELLGLSPSNLRETPREFESATTLNLDVSDEDLKDAKELGLDPKLIAERAIAEKIKEARLKAWVSENQSAFDAHAKDIEENGLWSDGLRQF